jgi:hypothetical protein
VIVTLDGLWVMRRAFVLGSSCLAVGMAEAMGVDCMCSGVCVSTRKKEIPYMEVVVKDVVSLVGYAVL